MNVRILLPLIFLLGFNAAAQKYQLRPVIVQVLPLGLDMTSKFMSNENGIVDSSQVSDYLKERGGKFTTSTIGLNMNLSVYVPVYKRFFAGFTYNISNSKSSLVSNLKSDEKNVIAEFDDSYRAGMNQSQYVTYVSEYERKISTVGIGIMYLPENPMRGLPLLPYVKLGVNMVNVRFSDVELIKQSHITDYNGGQRTVSNENSETRPTNVNDFSSLSFNGSVGLNININSNIQYTLLEANIAHYKMSTDNVSQFSLKTGVTILISKRK